MEAVSGGKTQLRIQKYPNTCGRDPRLGTYCPHWCVPGQDEKWSLHVPENKLFFMSIRKLNMLLLIMFSKFLVIQISYQGI